VTLLERQARGLDSCKRLNKRKSLDSGTGNFNDLLKEVELLKAERETVLQEYKENNDRMLTKLREAEMSNLILRSNFDDLNERLQGYKDYINGKQMEETNRCAPITTTKYQVYHGTGTDGNKKTFLDKNEIFIFGDEYAKGLGKKLFSNGVRNLHTVSKPFAKLANLQCDIDDILDSASKGSTLILIVGNNRNLYAGSNYFNRLCNIMKVSLDRKVKLVISSISYTKHSQKNDLVYRQNCQLYTEVSRWEHVEFLELNNKGVKMYEQVMFMVKKARAVVRKNDECEKINADNIYPISTIVTNNFRRGKRFYGKEEKNVCM
jgi:hypothetical protein